MAEVKPSPPATPPQPAAPQPVAVERQAGRRFVVIGSLGGGMEPIPVEQQIEPPPGLPKHTMRMRTGWEHGDIVHEDDLHGPYIGGPENVERLQKRGAIIPLDADHPVARAAREREREAAAKKQS